MKWTGKYLKIVFWLIVAASVLMCWYELYRQCIEDRYIADLSSEIVSRAGAQTNRDKIIALRDHIRNTVRYEDAPFYNRPFLRATAAATLQSREGYCGEVTRAFINLAAAQGIRAQRINLWGSMPHVVAEVEIAVGDRVIVDCQYPPMINDLEALDNVILRPEFDDYYTLNLRRLGLSWLMTRVRTRLGIATYWLENPHAIKASLWAGIAIVMPLIWFMAIASRRLLRKTLLRRGWVYQGIQSSGLPVSEETCVD